MTSEAPGDINSEIRAMASGGIVTRSSASAAFEDGCVGATAGSTCFPFTDFFAGAGREPGIDTTFQRKVVLSSLSVTRTRRDTMGASLSGFDGCNSTV